jgi:hypothetical protein
MGGGGCGGLQGQLLPKTELLALFQKAVEAVFVVYF